MEDVLGKDTKIVASVVLTVQKRSTEVAVSVAEKFSISYQFLVVTVGAQEGKRHEYY